MKPILFEIGPVTIYSYGFMLALGFLVATILAMRSAKAEGMDSGKILDFNLFLLITGIVGSRVLYVILNWSYFADKPLDIIFLNKGGLAIYGGFILAVPAAVWFVKKRDLSFWKTADLISPYLALAQSIGRVGCFLNGCCYGKPTDGFLGICFPDSSFKAHPTQIYSSLILFLIFVILKYYHRRRRFEGEIFLYYLLLYSVFRFFIEMVRGDNPIFMFNLTLFQCISAVLFLASTLFYIYRRIRLKRHA